MTALPFNATRKACDDTMAYLRGGRAAWGLSAIKDGLDLVESGRPEAGVRLARHGLDFMRKMMERTNAD